MNISCDSLYDQSVFVLCVIHKDEFPTFIVNNSAPIWMRRWIMLPLKVAYQYSFQIH